MTLPAPIIKNEYGLDWVLIDGKLWTIQNYSTTKLDDGTDIPEVTVAADWADLITPGWCWYNNTADATFRAKYGRIYNAHAVIAGLEMPCEGCRVPTLTDINELRDYLIASGYNWDSTTTGDKIGKALASSAGEWASSATVGDVGNDQASNNSSGLIILPGGWRRADGVFRNALEWAVFWTSTHAGDDANYSLLRYNSPAYPDPVAYSGSKKIGFSIRIVRDYVPRRRGLSLSTMSRFEMGF